MIYGDISEPKKVHKVMREKFGDNYAIKELGSYDCEEEWIPMRCNTTTTCCTSNELPMMERHGFKYDRSKCVNCPRSEYVRFADFEIGEGRAFIERKSAPDFLSSRRDRLYDQLDKLDRFVSGRKILLLEGTTREMFGDSKSFFSNYKKQTLDLSTLSPLEQCMRIANNEEWTLSFIRECFMRNIWFLQAWDINETAELLHNMNEGFDETPKLRLIPKHIAKFSTAQTMLATVKGIGKMTSASLLEKHKTLSGIMTYTRKLKKEERTGIYRALWDTFFKKPEVIK